MFRVEEDLRHFVNDGLMALFFFVVGLEIKREVVHGELADRRVAALPVFAAVGGMVVPALLYVAVAGGGAAGHGWGIPMATDIAFALGVLALLGSRVPSSLKLFLLTLAIVDDVGAIVVIAVFYSGTIDTAALARRRRRCRLVGRCCGGCGSTGRRSTSRSAIATWYATYRSGVHATIAGVALALTIPTHRLAPADTRQRWAQDLSDEPTAGEIHQMTIIARESVSPAEHLEELLHPATSFVVLPVFALANAGVELRSGMLSGAGAARVATAVAVGLVAGKLRRHPRRRVARRPAAAWPASPPASAGATSPVRAALGGIGFTVSLFIAGLAFTDPQLVDSAKLAVLAASATSAAIGTSVLVTRHPFATADTSRSEAVKESG